MQLKGSYTKGIGGFNWLAPGFARQDDFGWADSLDLYEGYLTLQPKPTINAALGKKAYTWSKGYAWNPVGFHITTNFEIHGELANSTDIDKPVLREDGSISPKTNDITSALVGIRYLSSHEFTSIIEYYHNGGGYAVNETALFHDLVDDATAQWINSGENDLPGDIPNASGYTSPYAGRNYLYAGFNLK